MVAPILAIASASGGCLVTAATYEAKVKEAEALRNGLASINREKSALEEDYSTVQRQLSEAKESNAALSSLLEGKEEELATARDELDSLNGKYEGTRITREELITELLAKEKATGERIQELNERAQSCERERERLRREAVAREAALSEKGRLGRLQEERSREATRRDLRYAELSKTFSAISSRIAAMPVGPAMQVLVPDEVLFRKGKTTLTDAGNRVVEELGKTASEFPTAAIIIAAGGTTRAVNIRTALTKGHSLPPGRVLTAAGNGDKETVLLLVIP